MEQSALKYRAKAFLERARALEQEQQVRIKTKESLQKDMEGYRLRNKELGEQVDILTNAVALLSEVSDETVGESYAFVTESLNSALARVFDKSSRQIHLREYTRGGMYPQLEIEVITEGGVTRSLKDDSGHGISQIISLLCILCLIVITGQRRLVVLDEMLSGCSSKASRIVSDILWAFVDVGFQFVISEHGLVVKGSHVYMLENSGGVSHIRTDYIERAGVYLDGSLDERARKGKNYVPQDNDGEAGEEPETAVEYTGVLI